MEVELATWHFAVAAVVFALIGALAHVIRAVVNLYPDKISDTAVVNVMVSDGYSWTDHFLGIEYDDAGFYKLDSFRNLKLSVVYCVFGGLAAMMFSTEIANIIAHMIEAGFGYTGDLFRLRIDELQGIETSAQAELTIRV